MSARTHETVVLYRLDATGQVGEIVAVARAVCIFIAFVNMIACGVVIRPAVAQIEALRNRIASQFFKIPLSDVKSALIRAARRADDLRRSDCGPGSQQQQPREGAARAASVSVLGDAAVTSAIDGLRRDSDLHALLQAARRRRAHRVTRITARLATPYAVVLALVVTLWYATYSPLASALVSAPANLQISSDRTYAARHVLLLLHVLATPGATYLRATSDQVRAALDQFLSLHRALTYGSKAPVITGTVHERTNQDALLYRTACLDQAEPGCATFASGTLNSGLHTAVFDYADRCRTVLRQIESWCGGGPSTAPDGAGNCTRAEVQRRVLDMPQLRQLDQLDRHYLFPALRKSEAFYQESVSADQLARLRQTALLIIAGYAALIAAVYWRLYRPTLDQVLGHGHQVRAMLSVVPDHVRLPGLQQIVNDHVRRL